MTTTDKLQATFAPRPFPADAPGDPHRAHLIQTPSDRMRDHAREFARIMIAMVPDTAYHDAMLNVVHDLVVLGEKKLQTALEARPDFDGFTYQVEHAALRVLTTLDTATQPAAETSTPEASGDEAEKQGDTATQPAA